MYGERCRWEAFAQTGRSSSGAGKTANDGKQIKKRGSMTETQGMAEGPRSADGRKTSDGDMTFDDGGRFRLALS